MLPLTTFYRSGAHRSDVYKWDAFVTSWRFYNRAWQPQRHDRQPETSGTLWIHRGALTNQRCSLATGCGIILVYTGQFTLIPVYVPRIDFHHFILDEIWLIDIHRWQQIAKIPVIVPQKWMRKKRHLIRMSMIRIFYFRSSSMWSVSHVRFLTKHTSCRLRDTYRHNSIPRSHASHTNMLCD